MAPTTTRSPPPTRSARRPAAAKASSPTTTILATLPRAAEIATSAAVSLLAQRLPCTADNAAQEFDARNVELFSQIQRSIDDGLAPRLIGDHRGHLIDEPAHRLDRRRAPGFERLEHVVGQVSPARSALVRCLRHQTGVRTPAHGRCDTARGPQLRRGCWPSRT